MNQASLTRLRQAAREAKACAEHDELHRRALVAKPVLYVGSDKASLWAGQCDACADSVVAAVLDVALSPTPGIYWDARLAETFAAVRKAVEE